MSGEAVAGAVIGSLLGAAVLIWLLLLCLRMWMRGPTKGTDNQKSLAGKTVVITGANSGIGKVTAHELSKRGAKVIMLCRNTEKAEAAAEEIRKDTGSVVVCREMDLASLDSVRQCAAKLLKDEDQIDYLINNAGVMMPMSKLKTKDGMELQFGTNHIGHFVLTNLLIPKLTKSAGSGHNARIVIVSSIAHKQGQINWDDVNFDAENAYSPMKVYCQSKLANVMHAAALARRLENTGITVYSLHPGAIYTEVFRHVEQSIPRLFALAKPIMSFVLKTPFYGAQTTLYCVLEDKLSVQSGKYYSDCEEKQPHRLATIVEDQERLWKLSEEMAGKTNSE